MNKTIKRRIIVAALAFAVSGVTFLASRRPAQAADPLLSAIVGTGVNYSYFVIDFRSGSAPQSYAFQYNYDASPTGGDLIDALAGAGIGFDWTFTDFGATFGRFVNSFTYDGKTLDTTLTPDDDYWAYWNSPTGDNGTWVFASSGPDGHTLTNGTWYGWSYQESFSSENQPNTPVIVPETRTLTLVSIGLLGLVGVVKRRR